MNALGKKIPGFLRDKYQLIATVTFTAFFSLVFILLAIPFAHNVWFGLGGSRAFSFTAAFFAVSLLIIIISKRVMYATRALFAMTYLQYILWNLAEVVLICVMYTCFTFQGEATGLFSLENRNFWYIFYTSFCYAFLSIMTPYVIAGMYFALVDKNRTIRLMNTSDVVSDESVNNGIQKITLFDNSGVMKLSVSLSNLYYIESDDNYIIVWYEDTKGNLKKYMIRCRLKTVEESFRGSSLVRCHRKYIVNMDKVKVLRKEKDGYELDLENDAIPPIAITKTYAENVLKMFTPPAI